MRRGAWPILLSCFLCQAHAASRVELKIQLGHSDSITAVAISPDGRYVLTAGDITARLWDPSNGREIRTFAGHTRPVTSAAFSPDGRTIVTGSQDGTARIWDVSTGRELRRFGKPDDQINSVAFSPDGKRVAVGRFSIPSVGVFDAASGREVLSLVPHGSNSCCVFFSRDGTLILNAYANVAMFWNASTGQFLKEIQDNGTEDKFEGVKAAALSPDYHTLATASRGKLTLWNPATGKELRRFDRNVLSLAFSPDSKTLLAGAENTAILLDVASGREIRSFTVTPNAKLQVTSVAFSSDGRQVLAGSLYPAASLFDAATGREIARLDGRESAVLGAVVTPDGRSVIAATAGPDLLQWDLAAGRVTRRLPETKHTLLAVAISADGRTVAAGGYARARNDQPLDLWDAAAGKLLPALAGNAPSITSLAISPDGRYLLGNPDDGGDVHHAVLWDLAARKQLWQIDRKDSLIQALAFSRDNKLAAVGGNDGSVLLRDAATGKELRRFEVKEGDHARPVFGVAFSQDGKLIATANRNALEGTINDTNHGFATVIDLATGRELRRFVAAGPGGTRVAFSPDARRLLAADGNSAELWDIASSRLLHRLDGHSGQVMSVLFSPDGRWIFTTSVDGTTRIWDAATGRPLAVLVSFLNGAGWAVVDPEGRYDASDPDNSPGLYWMLDSEVIELKQLKERFYSPGLLARILGYNREPLPPVAGLDRLQHSPTVEIAAPKPGAASASVRLASNGGGIGRVIVKVNGRTIPLATRGHAIDPNAPSAEIPLDLSQAELASDGKNHIQVIAFDKDNMVARGVEVNWDRAPELQSPPPSLYAIIAGVSNFDSPALNLTFPAKDAVDVAQAMAVGGARLFGAGRVHIATFASGTKQEPTKQGIRQAFESVARAAAPDDVLLVYFAGHGVAGKAERDAYYFLTREARSLDPDNDPALRAQTTISSAELLDWLRRKGMPLHQVIVLDTCAAGAAAAELLKLAERRELSADQRRAIELLKDNTGSHILMGAASDKVSYEANRYGQGLVTYALLLGMRGEALDEGGRLDVRKWFDTAERRVPELARGIGGIQTPVVSSPAGQTFPIAMIRREDWDKIPLARVKPQLLRATCLDDDDADRLQLAPAIRAELRAAAVPATRGPAAQEPPMVYLDQVSDDVADAYTPQVRYWIEPDHVRVRIRLLGKQRQERTLDIPGKDPQVLARRITQEIIALLPK